MDVPIDMDELLINLTNLLNDLLGQIEIKEVYPVITSVHTATLSARKINQPN